MIKLPIYADANAKVPIIKNAIDTYIYAIKHADKQGDKLLKEARYLIATYIGAKSQEIVFTSGGTESNALALYTSLNVNDDIHIITSAIEHPSIIQNLELLTQKHKIKYDTIPCTKEGIIDLNSIEPLFKENTKLISVIAGSNETGVIQPIQEIVKIVQSKNCLVHSDAVQALSKVPIDVKLWGVDMLSLSGHKIGAIGGIGALFIREGIQHYPLLLKHRKENIAGAYCFAQTLRYIKTLEHIEKLSSYRDYFENQLNQKLDAIQIIGKDNKRLWNTSCIRFIGCDGDALMMALDIKKIAISTGSACSSGSIEPSPILLNMGILPKSAKEYVRFSFQNYITLEEITHIIDITIHIIKNMRSKKIKN